MPLKRCGKDGWKWGDSGECYTGPGAKKKAIKQGVAIEGPQKFSQKAYEEGIDISESEINYALEIAYQDGMNFSEGLAMSTQLFCIEGFTEEITESNFYLPDDSEYLDFEEAEEEWDFAKDRPGLWENIRKKKEREGKNYKPAKPGDKDRPDPDAFKKAQSAEKKKKNVKLNKPFRTPGGPKKFSVYVKNEKGNVVKVNFGDPNMEIKRDDPARRKSFRARHNCSNPGPKWKARYWSCRQWRAGSPVKG
jgi:hypothetical protein